MTQEMVKSLSDTELSQVVAWAEDEQKLRAEQRKQEAIEKIKSLASLNGIHVSIAGLRGRPARSKPVEKTAKPLKASQH